MPWILRRILMLAAAVAMLWSGASAVASDVRINIGLGAPSVPPPVVIATPPPLVVVPGTSVSYAPDVQANLFVYKGRYHTVANGVWSMAPAYHGPWALIQIGQVPPPVLSVPVEYDKIPPGHLKKQSPLPWAGQGRGPHPKKPKHK